VNPSGGKPAQQVDTETVADGPVLLTISGTIATLMLNRPETGNAIDLALARELMHRLQQCEHLPELKVIIITGAGHLFSAGGDLKAIEAHGDDGPLYVRELLTYLHECISIIARTHATVIARINGTAAGAGFALACACDLLVAARSAKFLMAYTRIGLTPDGSSTWYLPRLVGLHRALALTLLNDEITAETLRDWGVIFQVVDEHELDGAVSMLATRIANGHGSASAVAKRLLRAASSHPLETQMNAEAEALCLALAGEEARAGLADFVNRDRS
jgi:2-(1,2-epoxy-1,2-dihydrophenyl)acetyl-CoA isomerase